MKDFRKYVLDKLEKSNFNIDEMQVIYNNLTLIVKVYRVAMDDEINKQVTKLE